MVFKTVPYFMQSKDLGVIWYVHGTVRRNHPNLSLYKETLESTEDRTTSWMIRSGQIFQSGPYGPWAKIFPDSEVISDGVWYGYARADL